MAASPLRSVLSVLLHPITVRVVGVVLLFVVLMLARMLLGNYASWLSLTLVWIVTLVVAGIVAGLYVLQRVRAQQRSQRIEEQIRQQSRDQLAATMPGARDDIEALQKGFDEALGSLRSSRLGRGALYALPWYVIIGPPGCGKTTLLTRSGLSFSSQMNQGAKGVRGIGGTRNCDWWFTDRAILLDTAGRYTTESEDADEWFAFLDMLIKARRECPLNGLLVAISIDDVLGASPEQLQRHAERIRARIDEVTERLGMVLPIYLLFTKCDLLEGFTEAFEGLDREDREQVWGRTIDESERDRPLEEVFLEGFDELARRLRDRRLSLLAVDRPMARQRKVFGFPLQFAHGRDRLGEFVQLVSKPDPYREAAELRGFYFTSGTQEGTPVDRALRDMRRAFEVREEVEQVPPGETKAYFIHDLLTDVIIPDQDLARRSSAVVKRQRVMRVAGLVVCGLVTLWFAIQLIIGTVGESSRLARARDAVGRLRDTRIAAAAGDTTGRPVFQLDPVASSADRDLLDDLRDVFVETHADYAAAGGLTLLGPDYELYAGLWTQYRDAIAQVFLRPMVQRIGEHLAEELPELKTLSGPGSRDRIRKAEELLYVYRVLGRDTTPLKLDYLSAVLDRYSLWSWTPSEILVGVGARRQNDPQVLHREAFLGYLIKPGTTWRNMEVSIDPGLAASVKDVVERFDPHRVEITRYFEQNPDAIYSSASTAEDLIGELIDKQVIRDDATGEAAEERRDRASQVVREDFERIQVDKLLEAIANMPLPIGFTQDLDKCEMMLRTGRLAEALRPNYEKTVQRLAAERLVDEQRARELFNAVLGDIDQLHLSINLVTGRGPIGSRVLPQVDAGVPSLVNALNTTHGAARTKIDTYLGEAQNLHSHTHALVDRIFAGIFAAIANEVRSEASSEWARGPGHALASLSSNFPFTAGSRDAPLDAFERLFNSDGQIATFATKMDRVRKLVRISGTRTVLEYGDNYSELVERAERIRRALLVPGGGFRRIELQFPTFETMTGSNLVELRLEPEQTVSTDDFDAEKKTYGWRLGGYSPTLSVKLDNGRTKRFDSSGPWSLFHLLKDGERTLDGETLQVVWTWRDRPSAAEPETDFQAGFRMRTVTGLNPFLDGFFELPASLEAVFREPEAR